DDGGMSVDATEWVFPGPEPVEFSEGPSNKGHDHHASPITPAAHDKFARSGVQKIPMTDQHASPIAPLAQGKIT
ncbi:hypothetical protein A2U01_0064734, partial [Trifolium medium]|nr:hypothetical protein [Trifolium medium]